MLIKMRQVTVFTVCLMLFLPVTARTATYNFYFNNTEQGDNSTATPSLVVKDEAKQNAKEDVKEKDSEAVPAESEGSNSQPDAEANPADARAPAPSRSQSYVRLTLGGVFGNMNYKSTTFKSFFDDDYDFFNSTKTQNNTSSISDVILSGSIFFAPQFAATLLLTGSTSLVGIEGELSPFSERDGKFDLGFLLGWTSVNLLGTANDLTTLHAGLRAGINFTQKMGLTASVRRSLGDDDFTFTLGELALALKF